MKYILKYLEGDKALWILALLFAGVSVVSVYSFIPILIKTTGGSHFGYLMKHVFFIGLGLLVMWGAHRINVKNLSKFALLIFWIVLILLVFTLFFGVRINDASRWVRVPLIGLTFQTSDFARLGLVIVLSRQLVKYKDRFLDWKIGLLYVVGPAVLIIALILKDNFSTSVILLGITFALLFLAKYPISRMMVLFGGAVSFVGLLIVLHLAFPSSNIFPRYDTWVGRFFKAYGADVDVVANAQAINAELAIHNGGYFGVGPGNGELKQYLPEAYADFYYASLVEEFGLISALLLAFGYIILLFRVFRIALRAKSLFLIYLGIGIGLLIISQAIVNMAVCTGLMPVTGQNMPFLAMGGTSMLMSFLSLGLIQGIARNTAQVDSATNKLNTE